jgi:hypothetical protein
MTRTKKRTTAVRALLGGLRIGDSESEQHVDASECLG